MYLFIFWFIRMFETSKSSSMLDDIDLVENETQSELRDFFRELLGKNKDVRNYKELERMSNDKKFNYLYERVWRLSNRTWSSVFSAWLEPTLWFRKAITYNFLGNDEYWYGFYTIFEKGWRYYLKMSKTSILLPGDGELLDDEQLSTFLNKWFREYIKIKYRLK